MAATSFLQLRQPGYDRLTGRVLEIGAFEHPAQLPNAAQIVRCDRFTREEAVRVFSEIDATHLPEIDVITDLDRDGLRALPDASFDGVVCCHVLEHLINPVRTLAEIFRVTRAQGLIALAVPDRRHTFDVKRPLTPWPAMLDRYEQKRTAPAPADYLEFVRCLEPQMLQRSAAELNGYLEHLLSRREHVNVWDTDAFREFLRESARRLGLDFVTTYEVTGEASSFEAFVVLQKL